jgi:two-component system, chemotaxis family, protein-glutamate methylesterase/glutaminase
VIAIGASTGGTEAIAALLTKLPASTPGIVIAQHIPPQFSRAFANRLNDLCALEEKEV